MGPTGDGPPRDRRLRSPSPVADTALYPEAPRPDRIRSQSTTHPKGPTTRLTAPAYWKFESISLQRRVRLSTGIGLARSRSRAFRANVRAMPGDGAGRDRYGRATSHHWRRMSLLGQISVPRGRRWIEADRGVLPLSAAEYWRT